MCFLIMMFEKKGYDKRYFIIDALYNMVQVRY